MAITTDNRAEFPGLQICAMGVEKYLDELRDGAQIRGSAFRKGTQIKAGSEWHEIR